MDTVLAGTAPFLNLFSYSTLLDEPGRPMHKSAGNAIEFNEAADKMGVDVMRWLFCGQKPENNLLFGYHRTDEVRRRFLIPLWNVYSFRLDGWSPSWEQFDPDHLEGSAPERDNPLDKRVLARINQTVDQVTNRLNDWDAFAATASIESLIDDLTNWYVRRSRRRFWRSEQDADKQAAYATLYYVLVKLVRLLAPITPFVAEEIYQNLVAGQNENAYGSIHHTRWPQADAKAVDESLVAEMGLARGIASLGLSARGNAGIKARQPLAKALVHTSEGTSRLTDYLTEIVKDELNVKELMFVKDATQLVTFKLQPDNAKLGPRFGADFPKLRAALEALDAAEVQAKLAAEKGVTVAVDAAITPELKAEGLARELVRRIQDMRKSADFNIEDRITTYFQADGELAAVFEAWAEYIQAEALVAGAAPKGAYAEEV